MASKFTLASISSIFSVAETSNRSGMDREGRTYTLQAIAMAYERRLFDEPPSHFNDRARRGQEYTAWAFWIWQVAEVSLNPFTKRHCPWSRLAIVS